MRILYEGRNLMWVQALLVICMAWTCAETAQEGFLSIDCGSDQDYYDNATGIYWVTDANYIRTGNNINITVPSGYGPNLNKRQVASLRYFGDERTRDCYVLPVQSGETYLVRATFYYGVWVNGSTSFDMYAFLDNTLVAYYQYSEGSSAYQSFDAEMIYSAPGNTLNFCLVRFGGPAFISALELRKLAKGMYAEVVGPSLNQVIAKNYRINSGPSETGAVQSWRYPDDIYDRTWYLFGTGEGPRTAHIRNPSISDSSNSFAEDPERPPYVVMEDAWAAYGLNMISVTYFGFTEAIGPVFVIAYFQELDGNASASNIRGMDFLLNGEFIKTFNISDQPTEVTAIENITQTFINMSFVQTAWSQLPPVLNAFEMYVVYNYNTSTTAAEDVSVINALQVRFNLTDWTGDPCLPLPFHWLKCTHDEVSPRIRNLSLANYGFEGNIPLEISSLTALTNLDLSNNSFFGSIPNFSELVNLQSIKLQNNNLSGPIPGFFGSAFPNLTLLELDNNTLSGTVPSGLDKQGLHLTFSNNPGLVTPSWYNSTSSSPYNITSPAGKSSSSGTSIGAVVGGIIGGLVALAIIVGIVWMRCTWKSRRASSIIRAMGHGDSRTSKADSSISKKAIASSMISLSLQEVSDVTKKFSTKIGEGSFGPVYHGKLQNGQEVAVKASKSIHSCQGMEEFLNEVELLSRIHHRNLVSLVGFCEERNQKILIYAYVSNGNLRDHLYGDRSTKPLEWRTRLNIALNSARGLEYLHTDCSPRIIHRDVKSSNILLDENMIAKVSDFGISKQTPEGIFTGVDTLLKGTPGYFDPEYFISQRLTQKSDVYSFGVVLLEIISGRHPHVSELPDGTLGTLIQWVRSAASNGDWMQIADPSMQGKFNKESVRKVLSLAIECTNVASVDRPDMKQVVRTLTQAVEVELFSENVQKYGQDATFTPKAEEKDEHQEHSVFNIHSLPGTEVPEMDPDSIVLPR